MVRYDFNATLYLIFKLFGISDHLYPCPKSQRLGKVCPVSTIGFAKELKAELDLSYVSSKIDETIFPIEQLLPCDY